EMHSAVETESEVKKCSLTAIGKVSTPASRIQAYILPNRHPGQSSMTPYSQLKHCNESLQKHAYSFKIHHSHHQLEKHLSQ
ncbi:hypothetical protein, partial [Halomonas halodenitrificans]|uniref:hypothetical protein n=1 Tax=Halomonas halodenitrificans TaxID=28252 RepID=UPI001B80875C